MTLTYLIAKAIARIDANNSHGLTSSPEYKVWKGMRNRCSNPNNSNYYKYGEKGIGFDKSWDSFEQFLKDMGKKPKGGTLDRKDPSKGYSKGNCRWSEAGDAGARGNDVYINVNGAKRRLKDVAATKGILPNTLYKRIKTRGMSVKEALEK